MPVAVGALAHLPEPSTPPQLGPDRCRHAWPRRTSACSTRRRGGGRRRQAELLAALRRAPPVRRPGGQAAATRRSASGAPSVPVPIPTTRGLVRRRRRPRAAARLRPHPRRRDGRQRPPTRRALRCTVASRTSIAGGSSTASARRFGEGLAVLAGDLAFVYADACSMRDAAVRRPRRLARAPRRADHGPVDRRGRRRRVRDRSPRAGPVGGELQVRLLHGRAAAAARRRARRPARPGRRLLRAFGRPARRGVPAARRPPRRRSAIRRAPASRSATTCATASPRSCSPSASELADAAERRRARRGPAPPTSTTTTSAGHPGGARRRPAPPTPWRRRSPTLVERGRRCARRRCGLRAAGRATRSRRLCRAGGVAGRGEPTRVVVVGAGLGGLSAACHLAGRGWDVEVVERGDGPGGRAGRARARRLPVRHRPDGADHARPPGRHLRGRRRRHGRLRDAAPARPGVPGLLRRRQRAARAGRARRPWREEVRGVCGAGRGGRLRPLLRLAGRALPRSSCRTFLDRNYDRPGRPRRARSARRCGCCGWAGSRRLDARSCGALRRRAAAAAVQLPGPVRRRWRRSRPSPLLAVISYMDVVAGVWCPDGGIHAIATGLAAAAEKAGVALPLRRRRSSGSCWPAATGGPVRGVRTGRRRGRPPTPSCATPTCPAPTDSCPAWRRPAARAGRTARRRPSCGTPACAARRRPGVGPPQHPLRRGSGRQLPGAHRRRRPHARSVDARQRADRSAIRRWRPTGGIGALRPRTGAQPRPARVDWARERGRAEDDLRGPPRRLGYPVTDVVTSRARRPASTGRAHGMVAGTPFSIVAPLLPVGPVPAGQRGAAGARAWCSPAAARSPASACRWCCCRGGWRPTESAQAAAGDRRRRARRR